MAAGRLEIRLLGRFLALRNGEEVPAAAFGGRKARRLVRVLLVRRGEFTSHDMLTEVLWPGRPPADPAANLGVLVNRARRALGDPTLITTRPGGYALTGDCRLDTDDFAAAVEGAREAVRDGDRRRGLHGYRTALDLWAGEPLAEDADEPWAQLYRRHLKHLHQEALEEVADVAVQIGESSLSIAHAEAAVAAEPFRETGYLILARALADSGDPAGALQVVRTLRRTLADELGLDLSAQAEEIQARLLRSGVARPERSPRPLRREVPVPQRQLPLLGRDEQISAVMDAAAAAPNDLPGPVAAIAGQAGAGKSRLIRELAQRSALPALLVAALLPERAEAWGLARSLLREVAALDSGLVHRIPTRALNVLADVVPELADIGIGMDAGPMDAQTRRALVLQGGVQLLGAAAETGLLVLVDDLQWADPSSLSLLASVLERHRGVTCVLAYRPEEVEDDGDVASFLSALAARHTVRTVPLPPLTAADLAEALEPVVAAAIVQATQGSPFAVTEVVRELASRGVLTRSPQGSWRVSAGAAGLAQAADAAEQLGAVGRRHLVLAQAARFGRPERELLALVSMIARPVPARTLAAASGLAQPRTVQGLSRLASGGLVRLGERGWSTTHDVVREAVVEGLPDAERGRLHGMLAVALGAEGVDPAEVAAHHAGAGDADEAARGYSRAARALVEGLADAEATELVAAGLGLAADPDVRRELLDIRSRLRARRGDLIGARADLQLAVTGCPPGPARSMMLADHAMLLVGAEDLTRAAGLAELAVLEADQAPGPRARALEVAAIVDMNLNLRERSQARAAQALALYTSVGDGQGAARVMDGRAMATFLDGDIAQAISQFRQVGQLFTDTGALLRAVTPRSTLGHALVFHAEPGEGLHHTDEALDLARSLGHGEGQSYALWHRSEALTALGRADDAVADARAALRIAEDLGHRGWTATALRALGIALTGCGDLDGSLAAFTRSLEVAHGFSLFTSWAQSRLAMALIAIGRPEFAVPHVVHARATGPGLARYEADLAEVELSAARGDTGTARLARGACDRARAGGHLASVPRLEGLGLSH